MKKTLLFVFAASTLCSFATSVSVTNNRGAVNSREVVTSTGTIGALAGTTTGFAAVGVLSESGITGITTTFAGLNFVQYGAAAGATTTSTSAGQFTLAGNVNITNSSGDAFRSQNIYLLVGFGGSSLATSTEMFIYRFNTTFGLAESGTPISLVLSTAPGTTLFGTEVGNPATSASGGYRSAALAPVPEPSAALLGMLGALGLLRRRR